MKTVVRPVADRSFQGTPTRNNNANAPRKSIRIAVLMLMCAVMGSLVIGTSVEARAQITIAQLNGPWRIALVGNTCGATSMLFTGSLTNGAANGWLTGNGGCGPGQSSETFTITSLDAHGLGKANLTCTTCGLDSSFNFNIQVAPNAQTFSLVDVADVHVNVLAGTAVAQQPLGITMEQLAGTWQIALVGNTGCGASSLQFTGTLNTGGTGTGLLTGSSTGCPSGSSFQTFTITSLSSSGNGSGTANLSCGSGCGWDFDIQVSPDKQTFNLVDVVNGGNGLAGTAVARPTSTFTVDQLAGPWQIALVGNSGCGQTSMQFTGTLNTSGTAAGTLTSSSTGCPSSSSTQTFTINPLGPDGTGTASLTCGSGCAWNFAIQVAPNVKIFNLVDTGSGDPNFNELAGTAVAKPGFVAVPDVAGFRLSSAEQDIQAAGLHWRLAGSGPWALTTRPTGGTFVPVGSTVTIIRTTQQN
jgi:hypothetical protein